MNYENWLIYLIIVNTALYIPGPMNIFLITNSLVYGYRRTVFSVLGGGSAYLILMLLVVLGLGVVIEGIPAIYQILKLGGASYFIYLGAKHWLKKQRGLNTVVQKTRRKDFYLQGFWVGMFNPKAIILFVSLFSQFLQPSLGNGHQLHITLLIVTFLICQFISASLYALVGANLYKKLHAKYFMAEKLILGSILIGLGGFLMTN